MNYRVAPLKRGEASGFCERGVCFSENQTPRSPSAHTPLNRGAAKVNVICGQGIQ